MITDPAPNAAPTRRAAATAFIFVTVMLDVLAMGIIVPVLPKLVVAFSGGDLRHGTVVFGQFGFWWAMMQFVSAPLLGALSDRFGRRPVILISNLGLSLDYILMALAPNLTWLFVGRLISGVTAASIPTATAYIADVTPPEKRAATFGLVGAAFGVGFVLGPALGGILGQADPRLPFWFAAVLGLANAAYGFFVLPESLSAERRKAFAWRRANPVAALHLLGTRPGLFGLAAISFLSYLAHEVYPYVFVLYANFRFGWDNRTVGLTLAGAGVCTALTQGFLTRPTIARLGERWTILLALACGVLGFALYGLAANAWFFWAAIVLIAPWGIANPAIQSLMSRQIDVTEQGRLQGALGSLRGIAGLIGPNLFPWTFAAFLPGGWAIQRGWHAPGAPFLVSAGMILAAVFVAWRTNRGGRTATRSALEAPITAPPFTPEVS